MFSALFKPSQEERAPHCCIKCKNAVGLAQRHIRISGVSSAGPLNQAGECFTCSILRPPPKQEEFCIRSPSGLARPLCRFPTQARNSTRAQSGGQVRTTPAPVGAAVPVPAPYRTAKAKPGNAATSRSPRPRGSASGCRHMSAATTARYAKIAQSFLHASASLGHAR